MVIISNVKIHSVSRGIPMEPIILYSYYTIAKLVSRTGIRRQGPWSTRLGLGYNFQRTGYNFQRRGLRDWARSLRLAGTGSYASMKESSSNGRV